MLKSSYIYLLSIFLSAFLYSSEYKTLYLMEFENSSNDYRTDYLRKQLPELISYNFSNLDFEISYAPNLLNTPDEYKTNTLIDGFLLYGKYATYKEHVIVSFDVYDVMTWGKVTSRTYRCELDDVECIQKAFIVCIKEDVLTLFCDYYDCMGVCDGDAVEDCNGECEGTSELDCNGHCNGDSFIDKCDKCVLSDDGNCQADCNGDWGGTAYLNECSFCIEGNTSLPLDAGKDCFGTCGGKAELDCNDECNGPAIKDCNNDCTGNAFFNECNVCVGGLTDNELNLGFDCNGECFGSSVLDSCGICGGDNSSCSDCNGEPYGKAYKDNCGICDINPSNDCKQDCDNDWGGIAFINECQVCVEGNTGIKSNAGTDCLGVCWGNSKIDECGVCNGFGAIYDCGCEDIPNGFCDCSGNKKDCFGQCGGLAIMDACGECGGNGEKCKVKPEQKKTIKKIPTEGSEAKVSLSSMLNQGELNDNNIQSVPCDSCITVAPKVNVVGDFNKFINSDLKKENTDKFLYIVDEFFKNAYNVFIKDINLEANSSSSIMKMSIPIEYSIKKDLFETLFSNLPHKTRLNDNGTVTIELSKNDFYIENALENYFSFMRYQVVPVIFFANLEDEVTHIHIDSWKEKYNFSPLELDKNIGISVSNTFYPLFSITPGESNIQINFELSNISSTYEFEIDDLSNFSTFSVHFMYENDIEINVNSYAIK